LRETKVFKFFNLKPEIFGIDINDLSLRIVKLKKSRKGFDLVSFNDVDIPEGIIKEGVIQDEATLARIIKKACQTVKGKKLDTRYVIIPLPEEKSFSQVIQLPRMTKEELRLAVPYEAENYIPLPIEKVYMDFQVINLEERKQNHLDLLINVMPKPVIDSYISCFKKVGLIPCIMEVESQAITRAFIKNGEQIPPTVFADFGETKTSLTIYSEGSIRFTVTVSLSSKQLTQNIAEKFKIGFAEAEKVKIQNGLENKSRNSGMLISAMEPVLNDLAEQIRKYVNFYKDHSSQEYFHSNGEIASIVLSGGGSSLKGLPEFLSGKLKIPVRAGDPFVNLSQFKNNLFPYKRGLSFATAIGSALRGADDTFLNSYQDDK